MKILVLNLHDENSSGFFENIKNVINDYFGSLEFKKLFDPEFSYENLSDYRGIILSGIRKKSTWEKSKFKEFAKNLNDLIENEEIYVLGICGGHELLATLYGYEIIEMDEPETDYTEVKLTNLGMEDPLFKGLGKIIKPYQRHKKAVSGVEEGILAKNEKCIQAVKYKENIYGVQFHPELSQKGNGQEIIRNFIKIIESKKY